MYIKHSDLPPRSDPNYMALWREKQDKQERYKLYRQTYQSKHPNAVRDAALKYRTNNPIKVKEKEWRRAGIKDFSYSQYTQLLESQNHQCAICRIHLTKIAVDHHHDTGKVRGILCPQCNCGVGNFKDNSEALTRAAAYLRQQQCD